MPPLRRTYASASLAFENVHHTVQPSPLAPTVLSPTPTALKSIINLPATSSRNRLSSHLLPRQSSLPGPRLPLRFRQLHPDRQIIPPFKPGQGLYRRILNRQFLHATKNFLATHDITQAEKQDPFVASLCGTTEEFAHNWEGSPEEEEKVCTHTSRSILIVGIDRISFQILAASIR
jgi:hypothetical protein